MSASWDGSALTGLSKLPLPGWAREEGGLNLCCSRAESMATPLMLIWEQAGEGEREEGEEGEEGGWRLCNSKPGKMEK